MINIQRNTSNNNPVNPGRMIIVARNNLLQQIDSNRNRVFPLHIQNPTRFVTILNNNTNRRARRYYTGFDLFCVVVGEEARNLNETNQIVIRLVANALWRSSDVNDKSRYCILARMINN
ncbi:19567_t:CDS:1 [Funneliformis geosporum]|uniref:221_t:CDS:1 n=1 Tax=Funneliformis geosporum TaxID=1117311 RepID=A0A9W4SXM8_9GLOM|nr:19567_t:CDS:1 [Funneliformis geosporum]CAI2185270.1 221_t:CDS:1 [Funneliformis geosporum]